MMKILVLFEQSGVVRDAFLRRGHDAISMDIEPTRTPGPHIQADIFLQLEERCQAFWRQYDVIIAHPPCTYICCTGNRYYSGTEKRVEGVRDFMKIWNLPVDRIAIENPVNVVNKLCHPFEDPALPLVKPYWYQPWHHGHGETKLTGIWSRGLPVLRPSNIVAGREQRVYNLPHSPDRGYLRAVTLPGVAEAFADQWGNIDKDFVLLQE